jgi:hypothetical protein
MRLLNSIMPGLSIINVPYNNKKAGIMRRQKNVALLWIKYSELMAYDPGENTPLRKISF